LLFKKPSKGIKYKNYSNKKKLIHRKRKRIFIFEPSQNKPSVFNFLQ